MNQDVAEHGFCFSHSFYQAFVNLRVYDLATAVHASYTIMTPYCQHNSVYTSANYEIKHILGELRKKTNTNIGAG